MSNQDHALFKPVREDRQPKWAQYRKLYKFKPQHFNRQPQMLQIQKKQALQYAVSLHWQ